MTDVNSLKKEARGAEQRGDWSQAIGLYTRALELGETGIETLDVNLYNRVGDLHLRLGDAAAAMSAYETAAERYSELGLIPSAIALCKKILRTAGGSAETRLRLARLEGRSGLFADARNNFLGYARSMEEEGRFDEALDALKELMELSGDEEGRIKLAEHLFARGRLSEAEEQLARAARQRRQRGADASSILRRISEMRHSAPSAEPDRTLDPQVDPPPAPPLDQQPDPQLDPSTPDLETELLEAKQGLLGEEKELPQLTSRLASTPDDHHSRVRYAQLLAASERVDEARTEFERALRAFEEAGEYREAMHVIDELLHLDPADINLFVRRIRVAARLEDEGVLIDSYLQLGGCIEKRLSSFSLRLLSGSSDSGDVSAVLDISQKTSTSG